VTFAALEVGRMKQNPGQMEFSPAQCAASRRGRVRPGLGAAC
jgi:hypothetical protein